LGNAPKKIFEERHWIPAFAGMTIEHHRDPQAGMAMAWPGGGNGDGALAWPAQDGMTMVR
jgi:hypothetical protein